MANIDRIVESRIKNRKNMKTKKTIIIVMTVVLLILFTVGIYFSHRITTAEKTVHKKVDTVQMREKELKPTDSFSVLLLGIDNGAYGRGIEAGRSDSMLVVTVNEKLGKTTIVSIPRDSYTEIVGYGINDKINHAFAFGEEEMSINSVQNMLQIPIDYYVTVNMGGLMGMINAIGGLDIIPALSFTYEGESFVKDQPRHVDGEAALRYARMRYDDPEGDFGRQKRQQYVIQKMVEKLLSIGSITKYEDILKTLEKSVRTNLTIDTLLDIKMNNNTALTNFEREEIHGEGVMIDGIYYYAVTDEERLRVSNHLRETLGLDKITSLKHIETKEVQTAPMPSSSDVPQTPFVESEEPVEVQAPVRQEVPIRPQVPTRPQVPVTPERPVESESSSEEPVIPEAPAESESSSEKPVIPEKPVESESKEPTPSESSSSEEAQTPSSEVSEDSSISEESQIPSVDASQTVSSSDV
ncbi:transcriptional attenuator, LytR family [Granulicatella balaenopterae]|uniref:Transcriptional attenuator, LytR family n=1 Tax=Granulicatella balaenopterae TaxID=137733 RepID=A0A1H9NEJ5_9LACT|nr:LCP family protein [Granulicatella balaenopterae]SER34380.1 transcriptional attenuator, LytR family [Granulicatella balaenopterae]